MSGGHFRSLQPRNGQGLHEKSASKKSPHFEKKWSKNSPSYEPSPIATELAPAAGVCVGRKVGSISILSLLITICLDGPGWTV